MRYTAIPKFTTPDVGDFINEQEGLYTLYLRGSENAQEVSSKRVISCISCCLNAYSDDEGSYGIAENPELRFITCNTTEAGIVYDPSCQFTDTPANSFPAKLTQFLHKRFEAFQGDVKKGFIDPLLRTDRQQRKRTGKMRLKTRCRLESGRSFH